MYDTEIRDLSDKTHIREGKRQSNKNESARQILHGYSRQHAIRMWQLQLQSLQDHGNGLSAHVLKHFDSTTSTGLQLVIHQRIRKGDCETMYNVDDFGRISAVSVNIIYSELTRYSM